MTTFNPDLQPVCLRHPDRAFTGKAPALATVADAYGDEFAEAWLAVEIFNLALSSGVKDVHDYRDYLPMAKLLVPEFSYLKVTELLYFFGKCKTGRYGKFYGHIDFMQIGEALREFCNGERRAVHEHYRAIREEEAKRETNETAVCIKKYLAERGATSLLSLALNS